MNSVSLVGRLTRDPELRTSPSGVAFVGFTIAVNRVVPNAQGERVADFINCVVFNKQAENLARFIKKGGLIGVEGRLQSRTVAQPDGTNRTQIDVVCNNIHFLESKNSQSNNNFNQDYSSYEQSYSQVAPEERQQNQRPMQSQPTSQKVEKSVEDFGGAFNISDDDLPF